jgi:hypothetical protein
VLDFFPQFAPFYGPLGVLNQSYVYDLKFLYIEKVCIKMPVSPQDFALWSRITGNPYPQTPTERMALAPQVYEFNRTIGRRSGPNVSPMRRAVDVVGKAALAAGALAGAAYLGGKYFSGEEGGSFGKLSLDDEPEVPVTGHPVGANPMSTVVQTSGDITPPTPSARFGQYVVENQTYEVQQAKGLSPIKPTTSPIEAKPATQSEVIGSQQHFSPGSEEEMLGQGAAERAAAFRKSKAYAVMQKQYPGLSESGEELIGDSSSQAMIEPVRTTVVTEEVRTPSRVRVASPETVEELVQVTEAARPREYAPPALVGTKGGPSVQEVRELDTLLSQSMARHSPEQRMQVRDQMLAKKYAPVESEVVVTPVQPTPVRVAKDVAQKSARVKTNEFLSKMSQEQGPLASYEIDPSRSTAVSGVAFYPGGEVGVTLPTKANPAKEYVYGASDPLRLALGDYAEEGFPSGMGHAGKILGYQGIAPGMGMLQRLKPGGQSAQESAPLYTGLMSEKEINTVLSNPRSPKSKVQRAGYDEATRNVMTELQERAAARRM